MYVFNKEQDKKKNLADSLVNHSRKKAGGGVLVIRDY